jgi:hypothetical protein
MEIEKRYKILSKNNCVIFFSPMTKPFEEIRYEWLWSKGAHEDMTNVSKQTRTMLEAHL